MSDQTGLQKFWQDYNDLDQDIEFFVTARLFEGTPVIWSKNIEYVRWRHEIAKRLAVDPMGVQLIGSARLGYSLSPRKNFKLFDENSDLDIAVVSQEIFDRAWLELRNLITSRRELAPKERYLHRLVFEECIALDIVLPHLSFGHTWSLVRDEIADLLGDGLHSREINYRLYRNHRALREYQLVGVSTARDRAIEEGA